MHLSVADFAALFGVGASIVGAGYVMVRAMLRAERERAEERYETREDAGARGEAIRRDFGEVLAETNGLLRELRAQMDLLLAGRIRTGGTQPPGGA